MQASSSSSFPSPLGLRINLHPRKTLYVLITAVFLLAVMLGREAYLSDEASLLPSKSFRERPQATSEQRIQNGHATPTPIVFSLIMWSAPSAMEGALLIKSILMYTSRPVDIHVICDDGAEEVLRNRLKLITRPSYETRVWYHKPTWQGMLDRIEREGSLKTDHSAGLPGLMKLFIHEILPTNVTKSIFVDTDAFFISDPSLLWDVFDGLKSKTSIVMSSHPDMAVPDWHDASKICSCVILLDLQKLRDTRLMHSSIWSQIEGSDSRPALAPAAFRAKYGDPGEGSNGRYDNVRLGDQGYWWAIVDYYRDMFEPLSYDFEVTSCLVDTYLTGLGYDNITEEEELKHQIHTEGTPQEGITVLPKLLHFNCLHGTEVYMTWPGWNDPNDGLNQRWGPALRYHNGYKWIWLNKGSRERPKARLEMYTIPNAMFADQVALHAFSQKEVMDTR